jgi:hypothetical protein
MKPAVDVDLYADDVVEDSRAVFGRIRDAGPFNIPAAVVEAVRKPDRRAFTVAVGPMEPAPRSSRRACRG